MALVFNCPICKVALKIEDQHAGRKIKCPQCGQISMVGEIPRGGEKPDSSSAFVESRSRPGVVAAPAVAEQGPAPAEDEPLQRKGERRTWDADEAYRRPRRRRRQSNTGLIIGLSVGGGVALLLLVVVLVIVIKKSGGGDGKDRINPLNVGPAALPVDKGFFPANPQGMAGSTWVGTETLPGYGRLEFKFIANNQAIMVDRKDVVQGTYFLNGNQITLDFGGAIYTGTVFGNAMSGSARDGQHNWTWRVNRR